VTPVPKGATATTAPAATTANPLTGLLVDALQALAETGEVDRACRIAGHACAALRHDDPAGWHRFNVLLHRLTRPRPPA
jgi:hypothetical protein